MGIGYNVYIGPYIECIPTKGFVTKEYHKCPKCKIKSETGKYCSKCGTKIEIIAKQVKDYLIDECQVIVALMAAGLGEDDLHAINTSINHWFVGNLKGSPGHHIDPQYQSGLVVDEGIDTVLEKQQLVEMYSKHIEVLKSLFGDDKVSIKWGVISYNS